MATKEEIKQELIEKFKFEEKDLEEFGYHDLKKKLKEEQSIVEPIIKETKQEPKKEKRVVNRDDLVTIMNTTTGRVLYNSKKTGAEWVFNDYGDTDEIEVSELITMKNAHPRYLKEPWLLVLDDDVVDYLGLSQLYENVLNPDELDQFFKLHEDQMKSIIEKAPRGIRQLIVSVANLKIANKSFDSLSKINLIEETFKIELNK
jgi:hypothetical protein